MPTECNLDLFGFGHVEGRAVVASFDGGAITSEAGVPLLGGPCCIEPTGRTQAPFASLAQATRTYFVRTSSNIWLRAAAAMATSVASVWSVRDRRASPVTRLCRPIDASTLARRL
jgi:hypothetical protein